MNNNNIVVYIATLGPIGYMPAGGTWASLCTLIILWMLNDYSPTLAVYMAGIVLCVSVACIEHALMFFRQKDPSQIVLDEVMGMSAAFILSDKEPLFLIVTFLIFRILDILKPSLIQRMEQLPGVLGVVADDLIAGYSAVFLSGILVPLIS